MKIKLAIFDLDGVITSTTYEHYLAWDMLFQKHFNLHLDSDWESLTRGVSRLDSLKVLLKQCDIHLTNESKIEELANEKNQIYQSLIAGFSPSKLLPGALNLLKYLKKNNVLIALGSASKNGPFLLKRLEIESYFDYIVDPSQQRSKPQPDIFLDAMNHFGFKAEQCIAFEDAISGIKAIKNAHIYAIGVGNELLTQADWHIKHLDELDNQQLEKLLEGSHEQRP
jgi:beta-phosphoglucomutase